MKTFFFFSVFPQVVAAYFKYMRRVTELIGAEGEEVERQLRNIWEVGVSIANERDAKL